MHEDSSSTDEPQSPLGILQLLRNVQRRLALHDEDHSPRVSLYIEAAIRNCLMTQHHNHRTVLPPFPKSQYLASTLHFLRHSPATRLLTPPQLKPPTTYQPSRQASSTSSTSSSSTNSFNKSIGPPRSNTLDRPKTSRNNARPIHTRSKSQAATRPRTAHGLYEEERHEPPSKTQSTRLLSQSLQTTQQLHNPKTRSEPAATTRLPPITNSRESSLNKWFAGLSLEDRNPSHGGQVIPPASSRHRSEIPCPPTLPQATPRRFVKEKGSSIGNINKLSRPTTTPEP